MRTYVGSVDPHRTGCGRHHRWTIHRAARSSTSSTSSPRSRDPVPRPATRLRRRAESRASAAARAHRASPHRGAPLPHRASTRPTASRGATPATDRPISPTPSSSASWSTEVPADGLPPRSATRSSAVSPSTGFRLPATEVWDWIRANRSLVDEKVFGVEPDHPALAVVDDAAPRRRVPLRSRSSLAGPTASTLVRACESAWADIRTPAPRAPRGRHRPRLRRRARPAREARSLVGRPLDRRRPGPRRGAARRRGPAPRTEAGVRGPPPRGGARHQRRPRCQGHQPRRPLPQREVRRDGA